MNLLFKILLAVICTEAITELAVKSEFFLPLRSYLFKSKFLLFNFIHKIFDCGYCFSVWAALLSTILVFNSSLVTFYIVMILVIHRLSNLLHSVGDVIRNISDT